MARMRGDRGQAVPLVVGVAAVMAVMVLAIGRFAHTLTDGARARTAADAAALAGASGGRAAAEEMARANGADLTDYLVLPGVAGTDVLVRVRVGRMTASARATAESGPLPTLVVRADK
jgi:hypothetical protein